MTTSYRDILHKVLQCHTIPYALCMQEGNFQISVVRWPDLKQRNRRTGLDRGDTTVESFNAC